MYDVIIIGAGISGLTLAHTLHRKGKKALILEPSDTPTGVIRSKNTNGFLLEFGPTTALAKPAFRELITELGAEKRVITPQSTAKKRFLARKHRRKPWCLYATPINPLSALSFPMLSTKDKLRLLKEPFIPCSLKQDESVHDFMTRRFGSKLSERIVSPMLSGIWAADITKLSTRSSLPILWEMEQRCGSITRGGITKLLGKTRPKNKPPTKLKGLVTFANGMSELPTLLLDSLPSNTIKLDTTVTNINSGQEEVTITTNDGETVSTKKLVITSPAWLTAELLAPLSSDLANKIASIPYAPLGVLHIGLKHGDCKHPLDGFGFLCPPKVPDVLLGAIFNSSLFPGRAPEGYHLLTCYLGGAVNPAGANAHLANIRSRAIDELTKLIGIKKSPEILSAYFWDRAIPNYPIGHYLLENEISYFQEKHPHISFLSNWLRGIGIPDRIREAKLLADNLVSDDLNH